MNGSRTRSALCACSPLGMVPSSSATVWGSDMLEPRDAPHNLNRSELRFLGGTENFDLWFRVSTKQEAVDTDEYPLRIHRVAGGSINWDVFKLPLHMNVEINASMEPASRIVGFWKDVALSAEDVQIIEAYLRCFAPGVLGEETNDA